MADSWTSATTTSSDTAWISWVGDSTTSGSTDTTWTIWADSGTSGTSAGANNITYRSYSPNTPPETEEQREARLERERERIEREKQRNKERDAAQRKAKELLRGILDKKQLAQFNKTKWFYVVGQSGQRYRIRHGWIGNIDELNTDDMVVATYCIHPQMHVPIEDSMAIQKLMLEADESRFKQVANRSQLHVPRPLAV